MYMYVLYVHVYVHVCTCMYCIIIHVYIHVLYTCNTYYYITYNVDLTVQNYLKYVPTVCIYSSNPMILKIDLPYFAVRTHHH